MGIVEIIGLIADISIVFWNLLIVVGIFGALGAKVFYEYFAKSGDESEEEKEEVPKSDSCPDEEKDELSKYTDCMCEISSINVYIFESSVHLRKLDNTELKYALEELKLASDHVCNSLCFMYELNYPISSENTNTESEDKQQ